MADVDLVLAIFQRSLETHADLDDEQLLRLVGTLERKGGVVFALLVAATDIIERCAQLSGADPVKVLDWYRWHVETRDLDTGSD